MLGLRRLKSLPLHLGGGVAGGGGRGEVFGQAFDSPFPFPGGFADRAVKKKPCIPRLQLQRGHEFPAGPAALPSSPELIRLQTLAGNE